MEHFAFGLDVQTADVDGQVHRYHLDDFLQDAHAVDAFDAYVGVETPCVGCPLCVEDALAVAGLEHGAARTCQRVQLHFAVVVDPSHHVVARYGLAAVAQLEVAVASVGVAPQYVGLLHVDRLFLGLSLSRLWVFAAFERTQYLGEQRAVARLLQQLGHVLRNHRLLVAEGYEQIVAVLELHRAENLCDYLVGLGYVVVGQEFLVDFLPLLKYGVHLLAHEGPQACARFGRGEEVDPLRFGSLRLGCKHLHLVARLQAVAQRHKFVVDLAGYAVDAYFGVKLKCHVEHCGVVGQGEQFAFRGKYDYLRREQVELQGVEKIDGVGLGVFKDVLYCRQPCAEFALLLAFADFVFPVCGESEFGYLVHSPRPYLHLYPVAVGAHHGQVQGLVAVGLRVAYPVACAFGV